MHDETQREDTEDGADFFRGLLLSVAVTLVLIVVSLFIVLW